MNFTRPYPTSCPNESPTLLSKPGFWTLRFPRPFGRKYFIFLNCLLSPLLLYLQLHLHGEKSPLKDLIEAQRSSLHRSFSSKLPSSGNQSTRASSRCSLKLHCCFFIFLHVFPHMYCAKCC